jgi:predicted XRE-type DNA-binding protein
MSDGVRNKRSRKNPNELVEASCGNVFADLEVPDADEELAKAGLVHRISAILSEQKLTQARAAALLGIDQPKISALLRGKFEGFSTTRLFRFLNALGQDVEITVRPKRQENANASTRLINS